MATLRQQLITQLNFALHQLQTPPAEDDCTVCFDVMDTTFEYDVNDLDNDVTVPEEPVTDANQSEEG